MTNPVVKVKSLAFARLQAPDLDRMEEFLTQFGMFRAARTDDALYMRGTDPTHHVHVTHKGNSPGFVSFAYEVDSEDDLRKLSKVSGASAVENIDEPGGGKRVRLRDPHNGYTIEAVHGINQLDPIEIKPRPLKWGADVLSTIGDPERLQFGPSRVKRMTHAVISSPHIDQTLAWFRDTFGLLPTDEFYRPDRSSIVGSFHRLDRGDQPVDHHVLNVYKGLKPGVQHVAYVVQDVDDLFIGHNHLENLSKKEGKFEHMRGVGYHVPGGQVFDYWLDPWGQMHEHWITTRAFTAKSPRNLMPAPDAADPNSKFSQTVMDHVHDHHHF
jgi:catechol 2,3-dioxygenase-like lactoylglutathione lyase family enzyme